MVRAIVKADGWVNEAISLNATPDGPEISTKV